MLDDVLAFSIIYGSITKKINYQFFCLSNHFGLLTTNFVKKLWVFEMKNFYDSFSLSGQYIEKCGAVSTHSCGQAFT